VEKHLYAVNDHTSEGYSIAETNENMCNRGWNIPFCALIKLVLYIYFPEVLILIKQVLQL